MFVLIVPSFRLCDLPQELRDRIYELSLGTRSTFCLSTFQKIDAEFSLPDMTKFDGIKHSVNVMPTTALIVLKRSPTMMTATGTDSIATKIFNNLMRRKISAKP